MSRLIKAFWQNCHTIKATWGQWLDLNDRHVARGTGLPPNPNSIHIWSITEVTAALNQVNRLSQTGRSQVSSFAVSPCIASLLLHSSVFSRKGEAANLIQNSPAYWLGVTGSMYFKRSHTSLWLTWALFYFLYSLCT